MIVKCDSLHNIWGLSYAEKDLQIHVVASTLLFFIYDSYTTYASMITIL